MRKDGSLLRKCHRSVISLNDTWYDVRLMTNRELNDFVSDLLRANLADLQSGLNLMVPFTWFGCRNLDLT